MNETTKATKGIKLDPKKSKFAKELEEKNNFDNLVQETIENRNEYQKQFFDLGIKFLEILKDKTLVENKGPISSDIERDILNKLIELGIVVNDSEPGMGSISLLTLVFKVALNVRNNYNALEYNMIQAGKFHKEALEKLQGRIAYLEEKLLERNVAHDTHK